MKRIILLIIVLMLVVPTLFIFSSGGGKDSAAFSGSYMEDVRVANRGSGKERWTLTAKKVEIPPDGKSSRLYTVSINLPDQEMDVVSDSGIYNLENRDLTLTGNIQAKMRGYVLKTESILLKSATNELSSDDPVVMEGKNFRIEGEGFHSNGEKKVTFEKNVRATFF